MPAPVTSWITTTFPTAKSLNLALYTCDGTMDNPNGIAFHAYRPILFESYGTARTFGSNASGSLSSMSSVGPASLATTLCFNIFDTAGFFGLTTDAPGGEGFYQFTPTINGTAGDGVTVGGWTLLSHFSPLPTTATQVSVAANLLGISSSTISTTGTRQASSNSLDSCPFFLDLINVGSGSQTWQPALTIRDSASASVTGAVNLTDSSGETPRFYSIWSAVSSSVINSVTFSANGSYQWVAPSGVSQVTASCIAGGGGGGGGNQNLGGESLGGGGAGGGELASSTIPVTSGIGYVAIVGQGGVSGNPGTGGAAGGNSQFAGDVNSVVANGGSGGGSASTTLNGTGGAGGTGSLAPTEFHGGAGASGSTDRFGGGGGSSAGTATNGLTAGGQPGASAVPGGGPGAPGGEVVVTVVQTNHGHGNTTNNFTLSFPSPVQAGNTVIAVAIYQGDGASTDPTATLNDGTILNDRISADLNTLNTSMQLVLYDTYAVLGGETSVTIRGSGHANQAIGLQIYEVSGLGPSPQIDQSSQASQGGSNDIKVYPPTGTTFPVSTQAPEFWMAAAGGQQTSTFDVNPPPTSQGWTVSPQSTPTAGNVFSRHISAYHFSRNPGTMTFSGTFTKKVSVGWLVVGYVPSANTSGSPPNTGPGGGGGGGFGANGSGGNGADGEVTLTWRSISGSNYGTPQVPAPFANWSDSTTIGVTNSVDVNINGNTGIKDVLNFLSNPPIFRIATTAGGTIATSTAATILFSGPGAAGGGTVPTIDNYSGWSGTANTYVIPRDGLYLFHGVVAFGASSSSVRQASIGINGTFYWGPASPATASGGQSSAKTQIFSLQAGDRVQLGCRQNTGSNLSTSITDQTRMLLVWLGKAGTPAGSWTPPDTTFRWASGTPGNQLATLFQLHMANDLGFLCNRPYLLTSQGTAQSLLAQNVFSTVIMDTPQGIIHNDVGDNYSGWTAGTANSYTAQVNGWYLMVGEVFSGSAATTNATVVAGVQPTTSGSVTPVNPVDWYQQLTATTGAQVGGGATVFGVQYLQIGESVSPQIMGRSFGGSYATLTGAHNGGNFNSHFEMVWLSE